MMKNHLFPVGPIIEFIGDISILNPQKNNILFISDSSVSTKKDLYHPYLQIHAKVNGQFRTISANGSFEMCITSTEYYNALKDYDIQLKNGYFFKGESIFERFVDDLYELRLKYPKSDPMNMTAKLIMNSLFGRFGLRVINNKNIFIKTDDLKKFSETHEIEDLLDLDDDGYFVTYTQNTNKSYNISVGIASFISSYSRVFMSFFKNNPDYKLYYTGSADTDSAHLDKPLDPSMISNKLGDFKLEYIFKEAVY